MTKLITILILIPFTLIMCTTPSIDPHNIDYDCLEVPGEFGDTLATGEKIDWNCSWEASYKVGNVGVIRNDDGNVVMVYRKVSH